MVRVIRSNELAPNLRPGDGSSGIGQVVSPAAIEFRCLLVTQRQFRVAIGIGQTLPQRDGQFRAIACGQSQKL